MHAWIGTDSGDQCIRCGMVLDYGETAEDGTMLGTPETERQGDAARALAFGLCGGPSTERAHHYTLAWMPGAEADGWYLECAYGDSATDGGQVPSDINPECIGA